MLSKESLAGKALDERPPNQVGNTSTSQQVISLAQLDLRDKIVVSSDGRRIFCHHHASLTDHLFNAKTFVMWELDGKPFKHSPNPEYGTFVFSPDGRHWAYAGSPEPKRHCVVLDGNAQQCHDKVKDIVFSGDSLHLAYVAQHVGKWFVVTDGRPGAAYDEVKADSLLLDEDGSRVAYVARQGKSWFTVINGREYDRSHLGRRLFASDGSVVAQVNRYEDGSSVTIGGCEGRRYEKIAGDLVASPVGDQVAYVAKRAGKWFVIVGQEEGNAFDAVDSSTLTFSPDGSRFAFAARRGSWWEVWRSQWRAVVDGKEERPYYGVGSFVFSSDSKRLAYRAAITSDRGCMVVDGTPELVYPSVRDGGFSPISNQFAYVARIGNREMMVVIDGRPGQQYESVTQPLFNSSGRHVAYIATGERRNSARGLFDSPPVHQSFIVVNDEEMSTSFDMVCSVGFESPDLVYALALRRTQPKLTYLSAELQHTKLIPAEAVRIEHKI